MITRLEIDGFRSFVGFSVDLRPLEIIAGPNASGKSNFFDALRLLSRLARLDSLAEAFSEMRGEPLEQFTSTSPSRRLRRMAFAVEAVLPQEVRDPWGGAAELAQTHLRYEVELGLDDTPKGPAIRIAHERLGGLRKTESLQRLSSSVGARWSKRYVSWGGRQEDYIGAETGDKVVLHQDGRAGRKREFHLRELEGTVLSSANSATFRHAFAMRQELAGVHFLHLEPDALRAPSAMRPFVSKEVERIEPSGANLPAVLARLKESEPEALASIARDLRSIVRDAKAVQVDRDEVQRRLIAAVTFDHGGPFPASLLSDGTLRLLALASLRHDPEHRGVLCFEEPENGIHPLRMKGLLKILNGLATPLEATGKAGSVEGALRQLMVNTHSPALVSAADSNSLIFSEASRLYHPDLGGSLLSTRFLPVADELPLRAAGEAKTRVTRKEVVEYLSSVDSERWTNTPPRSAAE